MARKGDGLYERKNAHGERTAWIWDVMLDSERVVRSFDGQLSRSVVKELANVERTKIRLGQAGIRTKKDITLESAFQLYYDYLEGAGKRANTRVFYECAFLSLTSSFPATRRLSTITTFSIEQHRLALVRAGRKRRQSADLQALRAVYRKAAELGRYNLVIPKIKVSPPKPTKTRVLSQDEERRLLPELPEPHRTLAVLYLNLGLRKSEPLGLVWRDVDLVEGLVTIRGDVAKAGVFRTLPMNSAVVDAVRQHRDKSQHTAPEEHVFWNRLGKPLREVDDTFRRAFDRAGLDDCTVHTCRHTFASRLVTAGVDIKTVMELGGWTKLEMLQRYAHSGADHKRRAVEILAETGEKSPQISQQSKTLVPKLQKKRA